MIQGIKMDQIIEDRIKVAFKEKKYEWRTIQGIANQVSVSEDVVRAYIAAHGDEIVKSSARNPKGEQLYTSRETYRKRANIGTRLSSVLRNRGA